MPASRILRLARTRRWARVGSGTRNARAISGVVRPPSVRNVRATRASIASAGWQHVKISRSRSSAICMASSDGPGSMASSSDSIVASRARASVFSTSRFRRRSRSIARLRAVVVIQAPGLSGTPRDRPGLERADERILDGLLGEVEVAGHPDERGDGPALLLAEQAVDDLVGGVRTGQRPAIVPGVSSRPMPPPSARRR